MASNVSADLVWEIVRNQNSYLEKRKTGGGIQFSRDPLNLMNVHSRKYAGFVNEKAIGVVPGEKGGVKFVSKKGSHSHKPAESTSSVLQGHGKSSRSTSKTAASLSAKSGYRADLRAAAVARASAVRKSQRPVKPSPEPKLRGSKAKKAAETDI